MVFLLRHVIAFIYDKSFALPFSAFGVFDFSTIELLGLILCYQFFMYTNQQRFGIDVSFIPVEKLLKLLF